jgi:hypothetical protein
MKPNENEASAGGRFGNLQELRNWEADPKGTIITIFFIDLGQKVSIFIVFFYNATVRLN